MPVASDRVDMQIHQFINFENQCFTQIRMNGPHCSVELNTGTRFISNTSYIGSIDSSNRTFVYRTKYRTLTLEHLSAFYCPKSVFSP